jgi:23S rRNA pseudouridine955/2504/2580 synthase
VRYLTVSAEQHGQRLDKVLARALAGVPRSRIFRLIRRGEVRINGHRAAPEQRLNSGDRVRLPPVREAIPGAAPTVPTALIRRIEGAIVHSDERLLVLDKPAGVAVHGGSGLSFGVIEALRASRPHEQLELVHRLDRDTSGILLIARRHSALRTLHALLRDGSMQKKYLTLVAGYWPQRQREIAAPLRTDLRSGGERTVKVARGGKEARTAFVPLQHYGRYASLLEATLHTGRTHQIRVHAVHAGHAVAGDRKYGDARFNEELATLGLTRMFLHAHSIAFEWPGGSAQSFSAPLPDDLRRLLDVIAARPAPGGAPD